MRHDEFVGRVQHTTRVASRGEAERAIRATLETLSERLLPDAATHLAAQLPVEIGRHLTGERPFLHLSLPEFYARVARREGNGVDAARAAFHAREVMQTLREAVSPGAMRKVEEQLPREYHDLLHVLVAA